MWTTNDPLNAAYELKDAITVDFTTITRDTLGKVVENFKAQMRHLVVTKCNALKN